MSSIGNVLVNEGLIEDGSRKNPPSAHTVQAYVNALLESYVFYDIKRFDIKGKEGKSLILCEPQIWLQNDNII